MFLCSFLYKIGDFRVGDCVTIHFNNKNNIFFSCFMCRSVATKAFDCLTNRFQFCFFNTSIIWLWMPIFNEIIFIYFHATNTLMNRSIRFIFQKHQSLPIQTFKPKQMKLFVQLNSKRITNTNTFSLPHSHCRISSFSLLKIRSKH